MQSNAPAGMVIAQPAKMSRIVFRFNALSPRASPTPKTAPTSVCVVEIGSPIGNTEANKIVMAAANSAQKPRLGVSSVILSPTVLMTFHPHVANPITIPAPPRNSAQFGVLEVFKMACSVTAWYAADKGPIALATSLEP